MAAQSPGQAPTAAREKRVKLIALLLLNVGKDDNGREKLIQPKSRFEIEESKAKRLTEETPGFPLSAVLDTKENREKYLGPDPEEESGAGSEEK